MSSATAVEEITAAAEAAGLNLEQFRYTMLAKPLCAAEPGTPPCLAVLNIMLQQLLPSPPDGGAATTLSEAYTGLEDELGAGADVDVIDADLLAALGRDGGGLDTAVYQFGLIKPRTMVQRLLKGHVMAVAFDADPFTSQPGKHGGDRVDYGIVVGAIFCVESAYIADDDSGDDEATPGQQPAAGGTGKLAAARLVPLTQSAAHRMVPTAPVGKLNLGRWATAAAAVEEFEEIDDDEVVEGFRTVDISGSIDAEVGPGVADGTTPTSRVTGRKGATAAGKQPLLHGPTPEAPTFQVGKLGRSKLEGMGVDSEPDVEDRGKMRRQRSKERLAEIEAEQAQSVFSVVKFKAPTRAAAPDTAAAKWTPWSTNFDLVKFKKVDPSTDHPEYVPEPLNMRRRKRVPLGNPAGGGGGGSSAGAAAEPVTAPDRAAIAAAQLERLRALTAARAVKKGVLLKQYAYSDPITNNSRHKMHLVVVRPHAPNELIIAPRKAFLASSNQLPPGAGADPRATLQGYVVVATGPCAVRAARP